MTHPTDHKELRLALPDLAATERLGARLAALLVPGLKIYLRGDLGSGKTTLIRAVLRGAGWTERVKSPTYALVEVYVVSKLHFYHFDFYRFRDHNEWNDTGFREHFNETSVCFVEWPEKAGDLLPPADLELSLGICGTGRELTLRAHSKTGEQCLTGLQNASS